MDSLVEILIQIVISVIVVSPILWLVGRALAGHKAKFTDAIWIVVLGTVIGTILGALIGGPIGSLLSSIIMFFVWLGLIKHFFDCGWIKAFVIAVITVIVFVVIAILLMFIGIGIGMGIGALGI
jgi:DNA integrity scanning protein DisA with diadenylate cyclase activity